MTTEQVGSSSYFNELKATCVPLLAAARLTSSSISTVSALLTELSDRLNKIPPENLTPSLISYIFFPISTIFQRNAFAEISDQILEKIFLNLDLLVIAWWWSCDIKVWDQIFKLCSSVIGGLGQVKARDDETKYAAACCMLSLLRPRSQEEYEQIYPIHSEANNRFKLLQAHAQNPIFVPVMGQTLDSLLVSSLALHFPLQRASLEITVILIDLYLPDNLVPTVLPGVVSTMIKVCLGIPQSKGWANGDIVSYGLKAIQVAVIRAISDEVCIKHGILRRVHDLGDLMENLDLPQHSLPESEKSYHTKRTESWLRGTSSQLHIAFNALTPLLLHPTPKALVQFARFSANLILSTPLALPQTQPLLLSFLLSLSLSEYDSVSSESRESLKGLLNTNSDAQVPLQHTLMVNLRDNLLALPRLLSMQTHSKTFHAARLIEAVCRLSGDTPVISSVVSKGIGKFLGPSGGIEKWGWSLLSVLEVVEPPFVITNNSGAGLFLESSSSTLYSIDFPDVILGNLTSHETRHALINMLHALGLAGGDSCIFAIEWFISRGHSGQFTSSVAALWCACKLYEGIARISLSDGPITMLPQLHFSKRLEKQARNIAKGLAETWDQWDIVLELDENDADENKPQSLSVQHQNGIIPLHETLNVLAFPQKTSKKEIHRPVLQKALCLQLIAISSSVAQNRFIPSFMSTLYPVLHSLVSSVPFLSCTAMATLNFLALATSYASPSNLILSNFDYVLDFVSRRLTRQFIDIHAAKILGIVVRLVGNDVVEKAGDVVEECFDRLDEFHGYELIVDGLIDALTEVIKVIEPDGKTNLFMPSGTLPVGPQKETLDNFFSFLSKRQNHDPANELDTENMEYEKAPRKPWGKESAPQDECSQNEENIDEETQTPAQILTKQIISRSLFFLTHNSPVIRARILQLLAYSVPILPDSALLPSIHAAWPFILNRLGDSETFVISSASDLVETLSSNVGDSMFRRVWDDVWPRFRSMLLSLERNDLSNALSRPRRMVTEPSSAYTHSHRLYCSMIRTMTHALKGVQEHELSFWEVIVSFRRFLSTRQNEELQRYAIDLYAQAGKLNPDAVWLVLTSTLHETDPIMRFLKAEWEIGQNVNPLLKTLT